MNPFICKLFSQEKANNLICSTLVSKTRLFTALFRSRFFEERFVLSGSVALTSSVKSPKGKSLVGEKLSCYHPPATCQDSTCVVHRPPFNPRLHKHIPQTSCFTIQRVELPIQTMASNQGLVFYTYTDVPSTIVRINDTLIERLGRANRSDDRPNLAGRGAL